MILDRYLLAMFNASNQNTRREFRWPLIGTASLSALVYPVMSEDGTGNVLFESFGDIGAGNAGRFRVHDGRVRVGCRQDRKSTTSRTTSRVRSNSRMASVFWQTNGSFESKSTN